MHKCYFKNAYRLSPLGWLRLLPDRLQMKKYNEELPGSPGKWIHANRLWRVIG